MTGKPVSMQAAGMETVFRSRCSLICAIAVLMALIAFLLPLCSQRLPDLPPPYSTSVLAACPSAAFPPPEADAREQRQCAATERRGLFLFLTAARFLSSKLWLLCFILYLFASGLTADALHLRQWAGLLLCLLPFLLIGLCIRRLLSRAIAVMESAIQTRDQRISGI